MKAVRTLNSALVAADEALGHARLILGDRLRDGLMTLRIVVRRGGTRHEYERSDGRHRDE